MRRTFVDTLLALAERDPRVLLLTGDLGFTVVEPFAERFGDRFVNVGVAEQDMVGLATGLAEAGFVPFCYSLATFASLRPYEFLRNGPVLHQLPVRLVGVGGGFEYGVQGATHHGLEDLGILRLQPGLAVVAPADHAQLVTALDATWDLPGPVYYRVAKEDVAPVAGLDGRFRLGHVEVLNGGANEDDDEDEDDAAGDGANEGEDGGADDRRVVVLGTGTAAATAAAAADQLRRDGVRCIAAIVAALAPTPVDDLVELLTGATLVVTVEAHYAVGGLGSMVAEVMADHGVGGRLVRHGVRLRPGGRVGSRAWFDEQAGITPGAVVESVHSRLDAGAVGG